MTSISKKPTFFWGHFNDGSTLSTLAWTFTDDGAWASDVCRCCHFGMFLIVSTAQHLHFIFKWRNVKSTQTRYINANQQFKLFKFHLAGNLPSSWAWLMDFLLIYFRGLFYYDFKIPTSTSPYILYCTRKHRQLLVSCVCMCVCCCWAVISAEWTDRSAQAWWNGDDYGTTAGGGSIIFFMNKKFVYYFYNKHNFKRFTFG